MKTKILILLVVAFCPVLLHAQDVNTLVQKVKAKLALVNDYEASGKMKTNVAFLKLP